MTPFACTRLETRFILLTVLHATAFTKRSKHCIEKVDTKKANIIIISTTPTLVWYLHGSSIRVIKNLVFQICSETQDFRTLRFDDACSTAIMNPQKVLQEVNRLYRILISESAHLIWKLRCQRVSEDKPENEWPKETEIHNRWLATINARLTLDRATTNYKYGKKALKQKTVLDTWKNTLKNEKDMPQRHPEF